LERTGIADLQGARTRFETSLAHSTAVHRLTSMSAPLDLSLGEFAVLGLVAEGQTHGFAAGREFAQDGSIGMVWTIPRPLVYRAIATLTARELLVKVGSAPGSGGPERHLVEVTAAGREVLRSWLDQPVPHVRDTRSTLLIKLLLLDRAGESPLALLEAQAELLVPICAGLHNRVSQNEGFEALLARYRLYSAEAVARLMTELIDELRRTGVDAAGA
jgi:DNA-binding PadR family transcriptional regulator